MIIQINLDSPARLPFPGTVLKYHQGSGIVKLERRANGTYLDGKKFVPFLSEHQKNGKIIRGDRLYAELAARGNNVSAKVLDTLEEHPEFWPEECKRDAHGHVIFLYFFDDIFYDPSVDRPYIRYGCYKGGRVISDFQWIGKVWGSHEAAASLENLSG